MNRRYKDFARGDAEIPYGRERYREGPPYPYPEGRRPDRRERDRGLAAGPPRVGQREGRFYRGSRGDFGAADGWSDQVWSGEGQFDEGRIGQGRYGYGVEQYAPNERGVGRYGRGVHASRERQGPRGRAVYGEDRYGWIEHGEPRYVGSLYRGERRGEEPYREHEWQRSEEPPGLTARLYARGPKGYTRSDERIKEDISEQLWRAERIDSSEVTIAVKDGVVTLTGTVPERWMRHAIEDVADDCFGVKDIENNVRVLRRMTEEAESEVPGLPTAANAAL